MGHNGQGSRSLQVAGGSGAGHQIRAQMIVEPTFDVEVVHDKVIRHVIIVVDASGSMDFPAGEGQTRLAVALKSVKKYVNTMLAFKDLVTLAFFSSGYHVVWESETKRRVVKEWNKMEQVLSAMKRGGSLMWWGTLQALQSMQNHERGRTDDKGNRIFRFMLVLTNGEDTERGTARKEECIAALRNVSKSGIRNFNFTAMVVGAPEVAANMQRDMKGMTHRQIFSQSSSSSADIQAVFDQAERQITVVTESWKMTLMVEEREIGPMPFNAPDSLTHACARMSMQPTCDTEVQEEYHEEIHVEVVHETVIRHVTIIVDASLSLNEVCGEGQTRLEVVMQAVKNYINRTLAFKDLLTLAFFSDGYHLVWDSQPKRKVMKEWSRMDQILAGMQRGASLMWWGTIQALEAMQTHEWGRTDDRSNTISRFMLVLTAGEETEPGTAHKEECIALLRDMPMSGITHFNYIAMVVGVPEVAASMKKAMQGMAQCQIFLADSSSGPDIRRVFDKAQFQTRLVAEGWKRKLLIEEIQSGALSPDAAAAAIAQTFGV